MTARVVGVRAGLIHHIREGSAEDQILATVRSKGFAVVSATTTRRQGGTKVYAGSGAAEMRAALGLVERGLLKKAKEERLSDPDSGGGYVYTYRVRFEAP